MLQWPGEGQNRSGTHITATAGGHPGVGGGELLCGTQPGEPVVHPAHCIHPCHGREAFHRQVLVQETAGTTQKKKKSEVQKKLHHDYKRAPTQPGPSQVCKRLWFIKRAKEQLWSVGSKRLGITEPGRAVTTKSFSPCNGFYPGDHYYGGWDNQCPESSQPSCQHGQRGSGQGDALRCSKHYQTLLILNSPAKPTRGSHF